MKLSTYANKLKDFFFNTILPTKCICCNIKNEVFCDNCINKIDRDEKNTDSNIITLFDYQDPIIKQAIWELKYRHKKYLGQKLGSILLQSNLEYISEISSMRKEIIVIPIPISKKKLRFRGYNQSESIARGFCKESNSPQFILKTQIVKKIKDNIPQAKLTNKKRRLENIKNAFIVKNPFYVKGKTFFVIDDVTTTGGTFSEVSRVLKEAGAHTVICFAIAH